jgi:glycosyltransferase involved in cell wall biosynthesis
MGALPLARTAAIVIRVLEVLATLKRAGAERMAVSLACGLDPRRFQPAVVSLFHAFPGGFEGELRACAVPVRHLGKRRGFDPRIYRKLADVLRDFRPDIVHTHSYVLRYVFPATLAAARKAWVVHTVHNVAAREVDGFGRALHRAAFRFGVFPVAVADEVARSFRDMYGFPAPELIRNGVDLASFQQGHARDLWRAEHGFAANDVLLVSVARLDPQKNPLLLIEAFTRATAGMTDCHLLLVGTGSLLDRARRIADARVHFLGVRQDIPQILAASDVFVLASDWEGNPMSVMEAMAAGLPVVATAVGGVPEVVAEGGALAAPGDVAALAGAIATAVRDPAWRVPVGQAARRRSVSFSMDAMVASYARLFERLTAGAG